LEASSFKCELEATRPTNEWSLVVKIQIGKCGDRVRPNTLVYILARPPRFPGESGFANRIRPAALKAGIRLAPGQRFGFHNFRHCLVRFLVNVGKDVKTIQGLLRYAKVTTTLDLYSQSIDAAKLEAQEDIALAITNTAAAD